jgi:phosphohistidine phosphatase SixA
VIGDAITPFGRRASRNLRVALAMLITRASPGLGAHVRSLEVRRHAPREPEADRLSEAGRALAEDVGRGLAGDYAVVFVSPAQRAAETVAWFLRGLGQPLPSDHAVVPGLAGSDPGDPGPEGMARTLRELMDRVPAGRRGLAVGHTPLIERGAAGLTGAEIQQLGECEGILVTLEDDGSLGVSELRLADG